jgi:ATP-binding cassette subfamily B protein
LIAGAVYKNPDFIFCDEATCSSDAENERKIMNNLYTFLNGKTVIVTDQGRMVKVDGHIDLVPQKGHYYNLSKNRLELGN